MRDERRKEERSKQGQTNNKATQHSTPTVRPPKQIQCLSKNTGHSRAFCNVIMHSHCSSVHCARVGRAQDFAAVCEASRTLAEDKKRRAPNGNI